MFLKRNNYSKKKNYQSYKFHLINNFWNVYLKCTINHDIIIIISCNSIRQRYMRERNILTERETHLKRPSSIIYLYWSNYSQTKNYKLVRMLERYLTSGREASNNRRTMNREKSWRKTWEKIFFSLRYLFILTGTT